MIGKTFPCLENNYGSAIWDFSKHSIVSVNCSVASYEQSCHSNLISDKASYHDLWQFYLSLSPAKNVDINDFQNKSQYFKVARIRNRIF